MSLRELGTWPVEGQLARKARKFVKITKDGRLPLIHGERSPILMEFIVSNDVVSIGEMIIPSGGVGPRTSELDSHLGDAVFYVLNGPVTFFFPKSKEAYCVEDGDAIVVPPRWEYHCINYGGRSANVIFCIGGAV
jgi:gentisate 1,2-dioxygenase